MFLVLLSVSSWDCEAATRVPLQARFLSFYHSVFLLSSVFLFIRHHPLWLLEPEIQENVLVPVSVCVSVYCMCTCASECETRPQQTTSADITYGHNHHRSHTHTSQSSWTPLSHLMLGVCVFHKHRWDPEPPGRASDRGLSWLSVQVGRLWLWLCKCFWRAESESTAPSAYLPPLPNFRHYIQA